MNRPRLAIIVSLIRDMLIELLRGKNHYEGATLTGLKIIGNKKGNVITLTLTFPSTP